LGKPGARASQPYALTPAGKRAFVRWLAESPGREAVRNPVALRVAFGTHQSAARLEEIYEEAGEHHNVALAEAREAAREARRAGDEFAAAALDFAAGYHKAALGWLKNAPVK
jgi:DNA-binding PadR family transcriptional regulator